MLISASLCALALFAACGGDSVPASSGTPGTPDASRGGQLYLRNGCAGCHSTGNHKIVGPGLAGIAERAATRVPGMSADEYISQSIHDPGAYVVDGYPNVMTSFASISDEDFSDLLAYLETLE
jgi:cytochrome c2